MAWTTPDPIPQDPSWLYQNWDKIAPLLLGGQQNLQVRGLDPGGTEGLYDAAFPASSAAKLRGSYGNDLMSAARMFLQGQKPPGPGDPFTFAPGYTPDTEGASAAAPGGGQSGRGPGSISGFDPSLAALGLTIGTAPLSGIPGLAAGAAGLGLRGANAAGFLNSNMMAETDQGPTPAVALYSGIMNAISNSFTGKSNFGVIGNNPGEISALAPVTPNMGFATGISNPAQGGTADPSGSGGWSLRGFPDAPKAPELDQELAAGKNIDDPSPAPSPDADTSGGVAGGAAPGGTSGGTSTSGSGPAFAKGGKVPGRGKRKATVHGGEFVMNPNATKAAGPALEALNALIPARPNHGADLDAIIRKAAKFIDV